MNENKLFVPISILIAGLIIAGAVFFTRDSRPGQVANNGDQPTTQVEVKPVSDEDHIWGDRNAEITIVEYSDLECPYCANFHKTMDQIMNEYAEGGKVAWVYRHFPLDQIHPDARPAAEASECVADLAGEEAFWKYTTSLFNGAPSSLSKENLRSNAVALGVDEGALNSCIDSGKFKNKVEDNYQSGLELAQNDRNFGTPYSVVIVNKTGEQITIPGAQQYGVVKQLIDTILADLEQQ